MEGESAEQREEANRSVSVARRSVFEVFIALPVILPTDAWWHFVRIGTSPRDIGQDVRMDGTRDFIAHYEDWDANTCAY